MKSTVVLNTRPRAQAAELSALLRQAGFEVAEAPAIDIVEDWQPAELERVRRSLNQAAYDWVVLASQNAGRALSADLASARIVCGIATAHALGIQPALAQRRFSASAALASMQPKVRAGQRVLLPRAAEGRDELALGLRALGLEVDAPIAYRTLPVEDAARRLTDGDIDVVAVCSPSAVESLVSSASAVWLARSGLACLGATTAAAAREQGLAVGAVAATTSMAALVAAVRQVAAERDETRRVPA